MNTTFRKYLPHAVAVVLFAVLTLYYFRPLLAGKELRQDDIMRHKAMSKEISDYREKHKEEPLWTNSLFGGMPAYQISTLHKGNWVGALDQVFKLFIPLPGGYVFLYFLGFYILLLCLKIDPWLSVIGAIAYGLSSYFLIILEAGHNSKANALGYLPALIGGIILIFRGRMWLGLGLTALFTALELNANHVQISYYGYMLIAFLVVGYGIVAVREKTTPSFFKALGVFVGATLLGVLPNAGNLLTTNEYGKYSTRGASELTAKSLEAAGMDAGAKEHFEKNSTGGLDADYATQWSYGIGETFTFLIPDYKGGASSPIMQADPDALKKVGPDYRSMVADFNAYFGDQPFTSGPVYIGAIIIFLAAIGMFIVKHPIKWPLFLATLLTIALSWGKNFMGLSSFFLHYVPGYNKFRAVAMILVVAELTIPVLAIMGLASLLQFNDWQQKVKLRLIGRDMSLRRILIICFAVVGGFCLACYLLPDVFNRFQGSREQQEMIARGVQEGYPEQQVRQQVSEIFTQVEIARKQIFRSDALRSFIFVGLGFLAIYLFFTRKIKTNHLVAFVGVLVLIDLWTVDTRYLNEKSFISKQQNEQMVVQKSLADEEILRDTTLDYRVLNMQSNHWQDAMTSYYHKSVGGYHGAKLKKYQELIDFHLDREVALFYREANKALSRDSSRKALLDRLGVINMLNTRYFILPAGDDGREMALRNESANGNAWFVEKVKPVADADEEIIGLGSINTKHEAVAQKRYMDEAGIKTQYAADGSVRLLSYEPNHLTYKYDASAPGFIVFSEIYYPKGWHAYLDGQLKPHIPVNYVLRGMEVPAGSHTLEFKFEPASYRTGETLAMAGSVLVFGTLILGIYMHRRNKVIVS